MKNHELLDMIGEVNEDYVQAADSKVVRPRLRWKTAAACAACAALILGAYPLYQAVNQPYHTLELRLHGYTVVEGGSMSTLDDVKAPAGGGIDIPGQNPPAPNPDQPPRGDGPDAIPGGAYIGGDRDGEHYQIGDIPVDEAAMEQYDRLLRGLGGRGGGEPDAYPEWFAGAWIDHGGAPETPAWLAVAIADGFRTPELEAQIRDWCGGTGEVALVDAKYSKSHLDGLMKPVTKALDGTGLSCGIGVDVTANCLGVDIYSDSDSIPEAVLAELARLDPAGDAIRVRLFTGKLDTLTDDMQKGPAPEARATPAVTEDGEPTSTPVDSSEPAPGGAYVGELPQVKEASQPAHYDLLPPDE